MSKGFLVLIVPEPEELGDIDDSPAHIFMRFTEHPGDDFLIRLAEQHDSRVYCLTDASSWFCPRDKGPAK